MKAAHIGTALVAALLAAACGGPGSQIASACKDGGELTEAACDCLGERADNDLTPEQQQTLMAMIESEGEENRTPSVSEMEVGLFLASAALQCQAAN